MPSSAAHFFAFYCVDTSHPLHATRRTAPSASAKEHSGLAGVQRRSSAAALAARAGSRLCGSFVSAGCMCTQSAPVLAIAVRALWHANVHTSWRSPSPKRERSNSLAMLHSLLLAARGASCRAGARSSAGAAALHGELGLLLSAQSQPQSTPSATSTGIASTSYVLNSAQTDRTSQLAPTISLWQSHILSYDVADLLRSAQWPILRASPAHSEWRQAVHLPCSGSGQVPQECPTRHSTTSPTPGRLMFTDRTPHERTLPHHAARPLTEIPMWNLQGLSQCQRCRSSAASAGPHTNLATASASIGTGSTSGESASMQRAAFNSVAHERGGIVQALQLHTPNERLCPAG